jgi:hypothetical protein
MRSRGAVASLLGPVGRGLAAVVCFAGCANAALAQLDDIRFRLSADVTYDDNVSRAREDDKFHDTLSTLNLGAGLPWRLTPTARVVISANLGGEHASRFDGLGRYYADIQAEIQYRRSGLFAEPIWGLFVKQAIDRYESTLRDGYRTGAGISVRKPVTDRVFLFGALAYNRRDGRTQVFDTSEVSLRGHLDYALSRRQTLYFGLEARDGDIVSTARPDLRFLDIADALVQDDVFTDVIRYSYRIEAYTGIGTLGYNQALGERAALDFSYRIAYSQPKEQPSAAISSERLYYIDNQATVSLLIRF